VVFSPAVIGIIVIGSLMNAIVVALVFLVCGMTKLAPFGVI
jgi:hypothetical protein